MEKLKVRPKYKQCPCIDCLTLPVCRADVNKIDLIEKCSLLKEYLTPPIYSSLNKMFDILGADDLYWWHIKWEALRNGEGESK